MLFCTSEGCERSLMALGSTLSISCVFTFILISPALSVAIHILPLRSPAIPNTDLSTSFPVIPNWSPMAVFHVPLFLLYTISVPCP